MNTMRAAVLTCHGGPEALEFKVIELPEPGAGEVLVKVNAAALNNTDIWTREGAYGLPGDPDAKAGWRGPLSFPLIQDGDIAGEIVSVGTDVSTDRVGQRVLADPGIYQDGRPPLPRSGYSAARLTAASRNL
ncbi:alcohol dehydrogenase catalytic domain-containing protein [Corynebacterium halotolerans]|uniref:alcohol dehydrogenase catalytic domain-containing protein n=1 Tax=Corynebacterium halotolerans TaxID=225326 RepID=UPI003CEB25B0